MWTLQVTFKKKKICHKPCKKYAGQEKCVVFFKSRIRIQDPDPLLKFWFAGSGSGRKWTGSATLTHSTYVRPFIEFSIQHTCSPWTEGDKKAVEKVQERAVKMVPIWAWKQRVPTQGGWENSALRHWRRDAARQTWQRSRKSYTARGTWSQPTTWFDRADAQAGH